MHTYAAAPAGARFEASTTVSASPAPVAPGEPTVASLAPATPPRRRFSTITASILAAAALAGATLFAGSAPALAHDKLVDTKAELSADGTRIALTLQFNNEVMDMGAEFVATGPDGADLLDGAPRISGRDATQSIKMPGFDKTVTVAWRMVSSDGHPISDTLAFAVLERNGGTELQFRDVPATPYTGSDPAMQPPAAGMWSPAVLWTVFTIMLIAAVGTSAIVAVKRKRMVESTGDGKATGAAERIAHTDRSERGDEE